MKKYSTCSVQYLAEIKGMTIIKIMFLNQSNAKAEKKLYCYTFYNENHTTYLYITCNKKIVFVKKYLSLL